MSPAFREHYLALLGESFRDPGNGSYHVVGLQPFTAARVADRNAFCHPSVNPHWGRYYEDDEAFHNRVFDAFNADDIPREESATHLAYRMRPGELTEDLS